MKKVKLVIHEGDKPIQDAGFRLCLLKEAQKESITHFFAENLPDKKTVEVLVGGKPHDVDKYVETIKKLGGNLRRFHLDVKEYEGDIMEINAFIGYLHTEQLMKGVDAVQGLGVTLEKVGREFAQTVSSGFKHMDDRFDEMPKKVAEELSK